MTTIPQACVNNGNCGWCGDKNSCIAGTFNGPLAPCLKSTYLYNAPSLNWNPLRAGTINIDTTPKLGERETLVVTQHPDFQRVHTQIYN